jgi:hypothetical protein
MATPNRPSVALAESFSDGDIEFWLRKYELCSEANEWKEDIMLKRLPTLLCGKAFAVFERLEGERKRRLRMCVKRSLPLSEEMRPGCI